MIGDVPTEACVKYHSVQMTSHLQSLIVNSHNKLRNNVALGLETRGINGSLPYASNMLALVSCVFFISIIVDIRYYNFSDLGCRIGNNCTKMG